MLLRGTHLRVRSRPEGVSRAPTTSFACPCGQVPSSTCALPEPQVEGSGLAKSWPRAGRRTAAASSHEFSIAFGQRKEAGAAQQRKHALESGDAGLAAFGICFVPRRK